MKKIIFMLVLITLFLGCSTEVESPADEVERPSADAVERPTDAQLHAYKAYHHARYMVITAAQAGGTNKLINTTELPTEGTDPVVTPALDHLYSKAVIDLTGGPVYVEFPEGIKDRYWSIHITDQEHYTIFDEVRPVGK
jgi:hypothetical protein